MFEGITIFCIVIGSCLIGYSIFHEKTTIRKRANEHLEKSFDDYEVYSLRIEELNTKILEVNEFSQYISSELDKKHQELLFLYQLIQEKTREIKGLDRTVSIELDNKIELVETIIDSIEDLNNNLELSSEEVNDNLTQVSSNKNKMILQLSDKGYEAKEIARMLDIGLGEVKLVLHLYE